MLALSLSNNVGSVKVACINVIIVQKKQQQFYVVFCVLYPPPPAKVVENCLAKSSIENWQTVGDFLEVIMCNGLSVIHIIQEHCT